MCLIRLQKKKEIDRGGGGRGMDELLIRRMYDVCDAVLSLSPCLRAILSIISTNFSPYLSPLFDGLLHYQVHGGAQS